MERWRLAKSATSVAAFRSVEACCACWQARRLRSPPASSATVSGSGALELAGTVSDLNASINIANNSTATAGIVVTGQNQIVGGIDGAGNVQVSNGGGVTANHITAGSLVIGNGGTFTIAPSDASGNPLAQGASTTVVAAGAASANSAATSLPTSAGYQPAGRGQSSTAAVRRRLVFKATGRRESFITCQSVNRRRGVTRVPHGRRGSRHNSTRAGRRPV